jgi:hypothetical protein
MDETPPAPVLPLVGCPFGLYPVENGSWKICRLVHDGAMSFNGEKWWLTKNAT